MKLSLKPQNNNGFQKNCRHFGVFKDGSQKLFDSILKKNHRVTFPYTTSSPYPLFPRSTTIFRAFPHLVRFLTRCLPCVSSLTNCMSCHPSPILRRARTRGLKQSTIPKPQDSSKVPYLNQTCSLCALILTVTSTAQPRQSLRDVSASRQLLMALVDKILGRHR